MTPFLHMHTRLKAMPVWETPSCSSVASDLPSSNASSGSTPIDVCQHCFCSLLSAASAYDLAATLVWEVYASNFDDS